MSYFNCDDESPRLSLRGAERISAPPPPPPQGHGTLNYPKIVEGDKLSAVCLSLKLNFTLKFHQITNCLQLHLAWNVFHIHHQFFDKTTVTSKWQLDYSNFTGAYFGVKTLWG